MIQNESEPSMDEILASIRQIISGDNQEEAKPDNRQADNTIIELVDAISDEEEQQSLDALETFKMSDDEDTLVSQSAFSETAQVFQELSAFAQSLPKEADARENRATNEKTVEALLRELLKPLLREWLDANLSKVVKLVVQEQVEKVIRETTNKN